MALQWCGFSALVELRPAGFKAHGVAIQRCLVFQQILKKTLHGKTGRCRKSRRSRQPTSNALRPNDFTRQFFALLFRRVLNGAQ